jgi:hypothetical protein
MITPETVTNVTMPELNGNWFFAQIGGECGREVYGQIVLAKSEEELCSAALEVAKKQNLEPECLFGFEPCEITIVSFPKWFADKAAARTEAFLKQLLLEAVAEQVYDYRNEFDRLPNGFQPSAAETQPCIRVGDPARFRKIWFLGTEEDFYTKFSKKFPWYGREGSASRATQPKDGKIFGVFKTLDIQQNPISITLEVNYDNESDIRPISRDVSFYFQIKQGRADLAKKLLNIRTTEYELEYEQSRLREEGRRIKQQLARQAPLLKFFDEEAAVNTQDVTSRSQ